MTKHETFEVIEEEPELLNEVEPLDSEPEFLNQAEIIGEMSDDLGAFLNRPMSFMLGDLYGLKNRRNTQDGDWKVMSLPLLNWLHGPGDSASGAAKKQLPALSKHPVSKSKEGSAIVLGAGIDGARKAQAMKTMDAVGLDIDSGAKLDEVIDKVAELGLFCIVYTSFNHGKSGLELKRDEVLKKLKIERDPSATEVRQFLREHAKARYEEDFIAGCTIRAQKEQTKSGVKIMIDTPPLDKFRLIFPLAESVEIVELAETHAKALAVWEDAITGLARKMIGVHFDTSATDPSRLFYLPRHRKDDDQWYSAIICGRPLTFDEIDPMPKASYVKKMDDNQYLVASDDGRDYDRPPECTMPYGKSINAWHTIAKDRFMLADVIENLCPDKVRGNPKSGMVEVECPFEWEHSSEGGTGCFTVNAIDSESEYWTWKCQHDACQGRHKFELLQEALRLGWFEESVLLDEDEGFMLPSNEEEEESAAQAVRKSSDKHKTPEDLARVVDRTWSQDKIENLLGALWVEGVDAVVRGNVNDIIAKATSLTKHDLKSIWKALDAEQRRKEKEREEKNLEKFTGAAPVNEWDFDRLCEYARKRVTDKYAPSMFTHAGEYAVIYDHDGLRIEHLNKDRFSYYLNDAARFEKQVGENGKQGVSAPHDVLINVYNTPVGKRGLGVLQGVADTPYFDSGGRLVQNDGYHFDSRLYLQSKVAVPRVSAEPSEDDVTEAKRLLIAEVLGDFPLGGHTREEIIEEGLNGDGLSAVTDMVGLMLLPFCREMIDGATPPHFLAKPAPGTGAGYLSDCYSLIAHGKYAPVQAMPKNREEVRKTVSAALGEGQPLIFFDNVSGTLDSDELALATTARRYQARVLGKSETADVDVRCVWMLSGNTAELSSDLLRRMQIIPLDAKMARPQDRKDFHHPNIRGWVQENRGQLVWACLTLIQNWIAKGKQPWTKHKLASYETWSEVIGGIVTAAGLGKFRADQRALQDDVTDASADAEAQLMAVLAEYPDQTLFRPGSGSTFEGQTTESLQGILNGDDRATPLETADPIQIAGFGYDQRTGKYETSGRIGREFRKLTKRPHLVEAWELSFEVLDDKRNKTKVYRMSKKPVEDQRGAS